jgi:transcriptional regulator with XRE-family HTH domain
VLKSKKSFLYKNVIMVYEKLIAHRKKRGFTQQQMARKIGMEQTTYSKKERGVSAITDSEWQRFANFLEVTIDDIKETPQTTPKNENCMFNDNSIGIQMINIPTNVYEVMQKYIQKLEDEILVLKQEPKSKL